MPNRLARESSPYLLQHADNPVDWSPWGEEAFARARDEDKPIFLSIGYSTCHWCHVMERESFEQQGVADVLNAHFVSIKVDREERPDVDRVYMLFVQATTGSGGWPLSVWLTPQLKPFFGGTYYPPLSRWGRPGFVDVLNELARVWREERSRLLAAAESVTERLKALAGGAAAGSEGIASADAIDIAVRIYSQAFDKRSGGFGGAPKFPRPSELLLLLRAWYLGGGNDVREMVLDTLRSMALGGMYDHIGGGFHRYSVDAEWRVPHFEKMLYDQAQLVVALLEAAQASGEPFWRWVAAETLEYVERDLRHPDGGFYSAEDADSVAPDAVGDPSAHKAEGAFYVWTQEEIGRVAGRDADALLAWYGVEPDGNAPHDPQGEFGGKNILYVARTPDEVATLLGRPPEEVMDAIVRGRHELFRARAVRPRPHLDDKVLTGWNGLMIAAFARAARVLEGELAGRDEDARAHYGDVAARAASFVRQRLWVEGRGVLLRRERAGQSAIEAFAEDYAYLIWGLLELFQVAGDAQWLQWAAQLQDVQDALFWDDADAGWFGTTGRDRSVLLRMKEDYDGAEPAASSVSVMNLLTLAHLLDRHDWREKADRTLARLGPRAGELARQSPLMLCGLAARLAGLQQIVIVGDAAAADTAALRQVCARHYLPFGIIVPVGDDGGHHALEMPWLRAMTRRDGRATAYVCRDFACQAPATSPDALDVLLSGREPAVTAEGA